MLVYLPFFFLKNDNIYGRPDCIPGTMCNWLSVTPVKKYEIAKLKK